MEMFRSRPETALLTPETLFISMDDQTFSAYIDAISNCTIKSISSCSSNPVGTELHGIPSSTQLGIKITELFINLIVLKFSSHKLKM